MKLLVRANNQLKEELLCRPIADGVELEWRTEFTEADYTTDTFAILDLLFENTETEIETLKHFFPKPIIVNSVINTLQEINQPFIRINGWPSLLKRDITEAACFETDDRKKIIENIFSSLGRKVEWLPDECGFISARIISMIINEAYLALREKVSSKEEIDIAMKLGTNYPFGPFEWSEKIGLQNIHSLLKKLSVTEERYRPSDLLIENSTSN